jgi:putative FmdB family regulatory protein
VPTYQYSCTECGHFFEAVQSFSDDSLTVCPQCSGRLRKVFNAVGVVFKGSGFYRTDSRGASTSTETAASSTGDAPKADTSTVTKSESKPAAAATATAD